MLQLLNLKTIGIALGLLLTVVSAAYLRGCSDGKGIGREQATAEMQKEVDKYRGMYQNLRDQPPKVEMRVVTKYVTLPRRVDTVAAVSGETEDQVTSAPYPVASSGTVTATYLRLAEPWQRFRFEFKPDPMRVDTIYVTETKTALEYVEVSIFEQTEFYILTAIAAVGGFALGGGF